MRIKTRYDFGECVHWKLPSEAGHFLMRFARFAGIKGFGSTCFCVFRTGHASYAGSCLLQSRKTERTPQRNQAFRNSLHVVFRLCCRAACERGDRITDGLWMCAFELALLPRCRVTFCKGAIANRWCPARLGSVFLPKIRFQHPPPCPAHHAGAAFFTLFFPHGPSNAFGSFSGFAGFGGACLCVFRTGHAS